MNQAYVANWEDRRSVACPFETCNLCSRIYDPLALQRVQDLHQGSLRLVYRPAEVAECLSLGDPFVVGVLREGRVLYG